MLKLIKEENVKPIALDQVDDVQVSEPEQQEVPEVIINNACQDIVNNLIQSAWNFISEVNSTIATIEYDFKDAKAKKEITELLNSIVDDSTVNIGILHKVFEYLAFHFYMVHTKLPKNSKKSLSLYTPTMYANYRTGQSK